MIAYLGNVGAALSQLANACIGGHRNESISARCWRQRNDVGWGELCIVINTLVLWEEDHCRAAAAADLEWARSLPELDDPGARA